MLTPSQLDFFSENGFLHVENILPPALVESFRSEAEAMSFRDLGGRRVWHERALFRRPVFRELLNQKPFLESAEAVVGPDVQLLALDMTCSRPGNQNIGWHRDIGFVCNKTLSVNTGIYLQDLSPELGGLGVVPGTHRWEEFPDDNSHLQNAQWIYPQAGDAIFFDAALCHAGGPNHTSDRDRWGLFAYFGKYWIKRMDEHFTQPLPASFTQSSDPLTRQLLGLGLQAGRIEYHGDNASYNRERGEAGLDYAE